MDIILVGACGRMGRHVTALAAGTEGVRIAAALEHPDHPWIGRDVGAAAGVDPLGVEVGSDPDEALAAGGVVVDFSLPDAADPLLDALERRPLPCIVATTGMDEATSGRWERLSETVAVLLASNLSMGAALLRLLATRAAQVLDDWDVEVVEAHHRGKKDAPSGTAGDIVASLCAARGLDPDRAAVHGRGPGPSPREEGTIGVHAVRGGTVTGEHRVHLLGDGERLLLAHGAESRIVFARGALRAARWIADRPAGLYGPDDVVADAAGGGRGGREPS